MRKSVYTAFVNFRDTPEKAEKGKKLRDEQEKLLKTGKISWDDCVHLADHLRAAHDEYLEKLEVLLKNNGVKLAQEQKEA